MSNTVLSESSKTAGRSSRKINVQALMLVLFGVCLPISALVFELTTRHCARTFFDPFPSNFHVLLFALIPLSNLLILVASRRDLKDHYAFICLLNGMASGLALTYTLMFLPLLPASLLSVLFFGFGLFGLAPLLAFGCSLKAGKIICSLAQAENVYFDPEHSKHLGHLVIIASIVAIELPSTLTRIHLHMASTPATAAEGINWLRHYGNEEVMLRACYERSGKATDILGSLYEVGHQMKVETARDLFYKVTGKPFNSVTIPMSARAAMQHAHVASHGAVVIDEFDVDADVGGEKVSGVARGLTLSSSVLDAQLQPSTATANLNWTFEFQNNSDITREARTKISLPHGAGINKIFLDRNGKRLEAHLKLRQAARNQYMKSVAGGEDPLLVSYCGPDEILLQCTPIRQQSTVRVNLQMVAPLGAEGTLSLPSFEEHNFQVGAPYDVTAISPNPIACTNKSVQLEKWGSNYKASAHLQTSANGGERLQFMTPVALKPTTKERLVNTERQLLSIKETIGPNKNRPPSKLFIIVDGSSSMGALKNDIARALQSISRSIKTQLTVVTDSNGQESLTAQFDKPIEAAINELQKASFVGGQSDLQAIKSASDYCANHPDTAILWIHNSQPIEIDKADKIEALQNTTQAPFLFDYQVHPGPNEILASFTNEFKPLTTVERLENSGDVFNDLTKQFSKWAGKTDDQRIVFVATSQTDISSTADECIDNVTTLWAVQRIMMESSDRLEANFLAEKFNLLTPISSAIVHDPNPIRVYTFAASSQPVASTNPGRALKQVWQSSVDKVISSLDKTSSLSSLSSLSSGAGNGSSYSSKDAYSTAYRSNNKVADEASSPAAGSIIGATNGTISLQSPASNQNEIVSDADEAAPTPEPETWLLLFIITLFAAAAGLLHLVRRRHKA